MGEARAKAKTAAAHRAEFLRTHPLCCFCGGTEPAVETDHVPSRALFADKQWPETYEFPACVSCNRATRWDEELVAMLSRALPDSTTESEKQRFKKLLASLSRHRPEVLREMMLDTRAVRTALRKRGIALPPNMTHSEFPLISVEGPLLQSAVSQFARKLGLALFYRHVGRAVPREGALWSKWWTNWSVVEDPIPEDFAAILPSMPALTRNSVDLSNQFSYRWGAMADGGLAAFLAVFRKSFAIAVFVGIGVDRFGEIPESALMRPFGRDPLLGRSEKPA